MNKTIKIVALLAVLSMAATGCQKEENEVLNPKSASSEVRTAYTVSYTVDDVARQTTLYGEAAHAAFIYRMLTLAEQGHEVSFYDEDKVSPEGATREVVTYTTGDKSEAYDWALRKEKEGYMVKVTYDKKSGTFTCVALR